LIHIYGLTGGIASGKSTVGNFFRDLGVPVVDADEIARDLRAPGGEAEAPILARFGTLDRIALRKLIASDPQAKKDLEAILHPLIHRESLKRFAAIAGGTDHATGPHYAIYEAALLVEAGRASELAGVILVETDSDLQVQRLIKRDAMDEKSARQFIGANPSDDLKRKAATHTVKNTGTLEELREKVRLLHVELS